MEFRLSAHPSQRRMCNKNDTWRHNVQSFPLQGLKEFLHFNFLRDDFKLIVKSAPPAKYLQNSLSQTRNLPLESASGSDAFSLDVGESKGGGGDLCVSYPFVCYLIADTRWLSITGSQMKSFKERSSLIFEVGNSILSRPVMHHYTRKIIPTPCLFPKYTQSRAHYL